MFSALYYFFCILERVVSKSPLKPGQELRPGLRKDKPIDEKLSHREKQ